MLLILASSLNSNTATIAEVYGDGIKSISTLLKELYISANVQTYDESYFLKYYDSNGLVYAAFSSLKSGNAIFSSTWADTQGNMVSQTFVLNSSSPLFRSAIYVAGGSSLTYENGDNTVATSTVKITMCKHQYSEQPPSPGHYDTGTDESALINNLNFISQEQIGKIYYIQSYYHNASQSYDTTATPTIETSISYKQNIFNSFFNKIIVKVNKYVKRKKTKISL